MTLTRNPDGTLTLTLTPKEQQGLSHAETTRGATALDAQIDAALVMFRRDLRLYEREQFQAKYDALSKARRSDVDAILAEAPAGATPDL